MSLWLNGSYVIWTLEDGRVLYVPATHGPASSRTAEIADAKCFPSAAAAWEFIRATDELYVKVQCGYGGVADIDCRFAGMI